jgi:hypothetical protein
VSGKENVGAVGAGGGGFFDLLRPPAVAPRQHEAVGILSPFLKNAKSPNQINMIFDRMLDTGNVQHIGSPKAKGLDEHHAFFPPRTRVKCL